jgi:hypothetical protein
LDALSVELLQEAPSDRVLRRESFLLDDPDGNGREITRSPPACS